MTKPKKTSKKIQVEKADDRQDSKGEVVYVLVPGEAEMAILMALGYHLTPIDELDPSTNKQIARMVLPCGQTSKEGASLGHLLDTEGRLRATLTGLDTKSPLEMVFFCRYSIRLMDTAGTADGGRSKKMAAVWPTDQGVQLADFQAKPFRNPWAYDPATPEYSGALQTYAANLHAAWQKAEKFLQRRFRNWQDPRAYWNKKT